MQVFAPKTARLMTLLGAAVLASCSDHPAEPPTETPFGGTWEFTLKHPADSVPEVTFAGVELSEVDGLITGVMDHYVMDGVLRGDQVELSVHFPDEDDGHRLQSRMLLTLDGDVMSGSGVSWLPEVAIPTLDDGTTHPKYEADHGDADILSGVERFQVEAMRRGALQSSLASLRRSVQASGSDPVVDALCSAVGSIFSFAIGYITGNVVRPMGGCWGRHDGGGYYIFGQTGPGSSFPFWTQTVYKAQEWSMCKTRTYGFTIRTGHDVLLVQAAKLHEESERTWREKAGIGELSQSALNEQVNSLHELTGGFAVSVGFSTHTNNWSIYVNTTRKDVDREQVLAHPLVHAIHSKYVSEHGSGKVWIFVGNTIHDTFNMRRASVDVCNDKILFAYLYGTRNVSYD